MEKKQHKNPVRGRVSRLSADGRTAKVEIPRIVAHPRYGRRMHLSSCVFAEAGGMEGISAGSYVDILPCRPVSKTKSWKVVAVLQS